MIGQQQLLLLLSPNLLPLQDPHDAWNTATASGSPYVRILAVVILVTRTPVLVVVTVIAV
jgi:hypothetical protein